MGELQFTGERMVPGQTSPDTFWEHVYRYRLAMQVAPGRRVLDIACGEGYGAAALLRSGALSVIGVDRCAETCAHAARKYGVDARVGDAEAIPLESSSVDLVVSLETIEHVPNPAAFLAECSRVLTPDGILIVSSPNRDVYGAIDGVNPYHCSELTEAELLTVLAVRFTNPTVWHQHPVWAVAPSSHILAADRTPFHGRAPGFRKLRKRLQILFCQHIRTEPRCTDAEALIEIILRHDPPWSRIANPFALYPAETGKSIPKYIIVAAKNNRP